jgi:TolB protein
VRRIAGLGLVMAIVALGLWWQVGRDREPVREGAPAWTPDGRRIVFYSERNGKADLFIADRSGANRRALAETPADEGGPAVSPDGQWVAFDTDRDGNFEIYVMRLDGTGLRRLTNDPARDLAPAWSPDGRQIVFMSTRDNPEFDVYRMDAADDARLERLTHGRSNWFPQYSPDGGRIAMHIMRDVHVLDLGTRAVQPLTQEPQNGMYPSWSPDGRRLAFMSWRNGRTEIFTANADGTDQQVLVSMPEGDAVDPRWSPAGDAIAFVHVPSGGLQGAQSRIDERIIYVYEMATRTVTRVSR